MAGREPTTKQFSKEYPVLARWIAEDGWIELGRDGFSRSLVRVLDEGGMIWESSDAQRSLDDALAAAEPAIERFLAER